jgi:hypothetical protein
VETFNLAITMRGVGRGANVFNVVSRAKGVEGSSEFGSIVCAHAARVTKKLENLFTHGVGDGSATLIFDKGEDAKLAEAAYGTEDVHRSSTVT